MNIRSVNRTSFESRFEKYHPHVDGIQDAITEAQENLKQINSEKIEAEESITDINEFANSLNYLLNDEKDDVYVLKPDENTNPYYSSHVNLYKNGECVDTFKNNLGMDRKRSYYQVVKHYVKHQLKQDVSEDKPEGLKRLKDLEDVTNYTDGYNRCPESLKITREGHNRIKQSLDYTKTVLTNLAAEEVYAKLDELKDKV